MKMIYRFAGNVVLSCLLLAVNTSLFSQKENLIVVNAPIPLSPTASAMLKSVDLPINHYTGMPQITIPLYDLAGNDLKVPLNLVYNGNGFKPGEIPGWIGQGWTLTGTGVIGRTINDVPDNFAFGFYQDTMDDYWDAYGMPKINLCDGVTDLNSTPFIFYYLLNSGVTGQPSYYDTEPDIYSYSLPTGESGRFLIDRNKRIRVLPKTTTRIDLYHTGGNINDLDFGVFDEQGSVYYFQSKDFVNAVTWSSQPHMIGPRTQFKPVNAWYIDQIRSARSSDIISYGYTPDTTHYSTPDVESKSFLVKPSYAADSIGINYDDTDYVSHMNMQVEGQQLSSISLGMTTVYFVADPAYREDLAGGHRLKQVVVMYGSDTLKSYTLFHSYAGGYLRLDKVVEHGRDGKALPPYEIQYYEDGSPVPGTKELDHWGYYNARYTEKLVPFYTDFTLPAPIYYDGANKEPDPLYARFGMPKVISYPTGGRTELEYEGNTYSRFGLDFEKTPREITVSIDGSYVGNQIHEGLFYYDREEFSLLDSTWIWIRGAQVCNDPNDPNGSGGILADCGIMIKGIGNTYSNTIIGPGGIFKMPPGTFMMEAMMHQNYATPNTANPSSIGATIKYLEKGDTLYEKAGPGVRVKRVVLYDGLSSEPASVKSYSYQFDTGVSSGLLHDVIRYDYDYVQKNNYRGGTFLQICYGNVPYILRVVNSTPLNSFTSRSVPLGYDRIIETQQASLAHSTTDNGKTVYEFYNTFDTPGILTVQTAYPNAPNTSYEERSGKLKSQKFYTTAGVLVSETRHTYTYTPSNNIVGFQVAKWAKELCWECDYVFNMYNYASFAIVPDSTIQISYAPGSMLKQITLYENEYRDPTTRDSFAFLRRVSSINSSGYWTINEFKYSFDFTSQSSQALLNLMTTRNLITPIYAVAINSKNNKILSGRLLNFEHETISDVYRIKKYYDIETKVPLTYATYTSPADITSPPAPFVLKATYDYGANGKISSLRKSNDIVQSFIWEPYDKNLLIADVKNAESNQIYYNGFETSGTLDGNAKTGKRSYAGDYIFTPPVGLTIAANSILSYWYWDTSEWIYKQVSYSGGSITLSDGTKIDEMRIFPPTAMMTTYSYNIGTGLMNITGPNNQTKSFTQDSFNRLSVIRDDKGNITDTYQYFYNLK